MARVLVTRPEGQEADLARLLRAEGHDVVHVPLIRIEPLGDGPIDVSSYDWVVVTSANGARELRRRARGRMPRIAAIGAATAEAMGGADLVAGVSTQEGLLADMPRPAGRVLFAAAESARHVVADALHADVVPLYRTCELTIAELPSVDLVVLASPSAARAYARSGGTRPAATIGPETSRAARDAGVAVAAEATTHDLAGLADAVRRALGEP
jgi:uroporphyrinogen-III synthase